MELKVDKATYFNQSPLLIGLMVEAENASFWK